jgi:diguanylate cyclase (GGDEF)-like protein/PAS domain S-box-containing protein
MRLQTRVLRMLNAMKIDSDSPLKNQLGAIQDIAGIGSWALELDSGKMHWCEQACRIVEIESPRIIPDYDTWLGLIHSDDHDKATQAYRCTLEHQEPCELVHRLCMPDGRIKHIHVRYLVDVDRSAHNNPIRVIGSLQDITEKKHIEIEKRIAATVFQTSNAAIFIMTSDNLIVRVNQSFTEITGYEPEEIIEKKPTMFSSGRHDAAFFHDMQVALLQNGFWQGEVWDRHKRGHCYPKWLRMTAVQDDDGSATHYVGIFSDISERKVAEEKIHNLAFYDPLTRLPNRNRFVAHLESVIAVCNQGKSCGALLSLDLDNFQMLNDIKGHPVGDELLVDVSQQLLGIQAKHEKIIVARLGGDEFGVLLQGLSRDREDALTEVGRLAAEILALFIVPYTLSSGVHHSTASIGIAFTEPGITVHTLLARADAAMHQAKRAGKNTYRTFDPEIQQALEKRAEREIELRQVARSLQLRLLYQTQVDEYGRCIGVEALLRWQHPVLGMIHPMEFIPLAEETGFIGEIGKWVLETACAQLMHWGRKPETQRLSIAVNVSVRQFYQPGFVDQVRAIIAQYGIDAARLKLELTESIVLKNIDEAIALMRELKTLGLTLSMDDFGTGYSSLNYLKRLPFDQVKIDKSFVQGVAGNANDVFIISTVIMLGQLLNMSVIAEGVEDLTQYEHLKALGCKLFQGYYFGKPMPANELVF